MSSTCRRVVTAGGLALAVLLPLYFNPFAAAPFEPPKVALFRALVAGLIAVRAVCALVEPRGGSARLPAQAAGPGAATRNPLAWPVLFYASAGVLATVASVDPEQSLWGSASNPHGTVTTLCLVAFFFLIAEALSTGEHLDRMVSALLLGSVPVAIYGLAQYLGRDPLQWLTHPVSRTLSTMGNSIFLGAYLAMVVPFTLSRLVAARERRGTWRYGVVLALQVTCLLFTRARGAWLGFLGASLLFLVCLAWRRRRKVLLPAAVVFLLAGGWAFAAMSGAGRTLQAPGQAARAAEQGASLSKIRAASLGARIAIWRGTLALIPERWLLGHGPETFAQVFAAHYPPDLARYQPREQIVDDPHNILLEHCASAGVVGLVAFVGLLATFFWVTLCALGRAADKASEATVVAIASSATAFLIYAQFNPDVIALSALFWLDLALGVAALRRANPTSGEHAYRRQGFPSPLQQ